MYSMFPFIKMVGMRRYIPMCLSSQIYPGMIQKKLIEKGLSRERGSTSGVDGRQTGRWGYIFLCYLIFEPYEY